MDLQKRLTAQGRWRKERQEAEDLRQKTKDKRQKKVSSWELRVEICELIVSFECLNE